MKRKSLLLSMCIILSLSGCGSISQKDYDAKVSELESIKKEFESSKTELSELKSELENAKKQLSASQTELESTKNLYEQTKEQMENLEKEKSEDADASVDEAASKEVTTNNELDTSSSNTPSSLKYGKLLDANPNGGADGNTLVIKAKIEPNLTNDLTISQNYHNIIDLILEQDCVTYDSIDYWAVADMADGSEGKVISFLVNSECINGIKNETIVAITLEQHLQDLWILPSLQQ